ELNVGYAESAHPAPTRGAQRGDEEPEEQREDKGADCHRDGGGPAAHQRREEVPAFVDQHLPDALQLRRHLALLQMLEELARTRLLWSLQHFARGAGFDDLAAVHEDDAFGVLAGELDLLRD